MIKEGYNCISQSIVRYPLDLSRVLFVSSVDRWKGLGHNQFVFLLCLDYSSF